MNIAIERECAQTKIIGADLVLLRELVAAFADRVVSGSECNDPDFRRSVCNDFRFRYYTARGFKLARKPLHVVVIIVRTFAVLRLLIVSATSREVGSRRMIGSWQCTVGNRVAIYIFIARKSAQSSE